MNDTIHILTTRIAPDFLITFERFQETHRIYAVDSSGQLYQKDEQYIDEWDDEKKQQVIEILNYYIDRGGVVVAIQKGETLFGFAGLDGMSVCRDEFGHQPVLDCFSLLVWGVEPRICVRWVLRCTERN